MPFRAQEADQAAALPPSPAWRRPFHGQSPGLTLPVRKPRKSECCSQGDLTANDGGVSLDVETMWAGPREAY